MYVNNDRKTDTLTLDISEGVVVESDELFPGIIVDYGENKKVLRMEFLHASAPHGRVVLAYDDEECWT